MSEWGDFERSLGVKNFLNFKFSGVNKSVNQVWSSVWVAMVDELWKHRNRKIFKSGKIDHIEIFTMVQLKVWYHG